MFGNNNKSNGSTDETPADPNALNSLVNGTEVEGDITSKNDIRIDGRLNGSLNAGGKVIIGPHGRVDGDILCETAVIEGEFDGGLTVKDTLQVKESAKIYGEVQTEKLVVQSGAIFNVGCKMGEQIVREQSDSSPKQKSKGKPKSAKANN